MKIKMHTYLFEYDTSIDDFGEISFCAKTVKEAFDLFNDWCLNDMGLKFYIPASITEVFNAEDAAIYGDAYGRG